MPKSDMWPGGVALDSLSKMDSAGSCDSVISMNSGYSEDSMEHLSAEERACLMYLEETIEALEVQEDSGLSNDEPDPLLEAEKMRQMSVNDISIFKSESGRDQKAESLNETLEPQSSLASAANTKDLETSADLMIQPKVTEPVTGSEIHPSVSHPEELCLSKDADGKLQIVSSASQSKMNLDLIPPPSDFMDEPHPRPQPLTARDPIASAVISNNKPATVDLEQLRQRASTKRTSVNPPVTQEPPNKPPEVSPLTISFGPPMSPPPEAVEPRSPPAVAPKPKKLPANIILKSHKAAVADSNPAHSVPTNDDRLIMDPQRVRMEALRKLGLLKSEEVDSGPALSPKHSPKTRSAWEALPSPISPATPHAPPLTPSYTRVNPPSPTAPAVELPDIVPAPAAFSDPDGALLSDNELSAVKYVSEATAKMNTPALMKQLTPPKAKGVKSATLERSGLGLSSYISSQVSDEASLGVSNKQTPSQLRNSRPRPASLGSGKEFSNAQGERSQVGHAVSKEPDLPRSLPAFQHSGDPQKLPRSQGISVLICPRAENGDNRREALKRLGLLRD
ncbi:Specifically androgen-regulated gene protein [Collichthys lucidus]|uniref:Specifically androgen-regulated gene protein n=1 Tax=Collichthys lucidus TaxID=240159 RepID=A0A4U5USF8_COLLU|nr:Specifically androgen-regulated gene protein [Collichthys lucidus]